MARVVAPLAAISHDGGNVIIWQAPPGQGKRGGNPARSTTDPMDSHTLDAQGLLCPLPVLKARKALKAMAAGEILEVLATDPGAVKDFAAFCRTTGHELVASSESAGIFRFAIRKSAS